MRTILRTLAAISLAAALPGWAEGIAFLSNLKGDVAVDGNARPILLAELSRCAKLVLGREAQASVMFVSSGKEYALKGPGEFLVKDTEIAASSGMPPMTRETAWRASSMPWSVFRHRHPNAAAAHCANRCRTVNADG